MTQRNVCHLKCPHCHPTQISHNGWTKKYTIEGRCVTDGNWSASKAVEIEESKCHHNIGFEVLDKKQWAAVEVLRKMIPSDTLRPTRDDAQYLNRAVAAFDESEEERK